MTTKIGVDLLEKNQTAAGDVITLRLRGFKKTL